MSGRKRDRLGEFFWSAAADRGGVVLERWDRVAPLTGIGTVVLWILAVVVLEGAGSPPNDDPTPQALQEYFQSDENSIYVGAVLFFIGAAILIWWSGALRAS